MARVLIGLDKTFRVVHAPPPLAHLVGQTLEELLATAASPAIDIAGVEYVLILHPDDGGATMFFGLVARSEAMLRIFARLENLRNSDAPILLMGERGSGMSALARAVHASSRRREGPFVAAESDFEAALERAAGGTLLLERVADIPLQLQAELLEQRDARIIAATSVDLRRAIAESRFREDLYLHLRAVTIELPPLRTRREDIEPIARCLLARACARQGRELDLAPDAMRALLRHSWPGNVRELQTAIELAVAASNGPAIRASDLQLETPARGNGQAQSIVAALEANRWNRETTARALGISRTTLWRKMRELGLN